MPTYVFKNRHIQAIEGIVMLRTKSDYHWPEEVVIIYRPDLKEQITNCKHHETTT